ncbi:MAG: pirin family protein [Salibacteraceae bacterium]
MKKSVLKIVNSQPVRMGDVIIGQPIPQGTLDEVNPFILLHHAGPKKISVHEPGFFVPPHPHRGFEPVTFVFQGEVEHKDSLGNESVVKAGGVQWITSGSGIIHSEGNPKSFIEKGGVMEIIQLWINLPSSLKMSPPNYQAFDQSDIPQIKQHKSVVNIISGEMKNERGPINSLTNISAFTVVLDKDGLAKIDLPKDQNALVFQLNGNTIVNDSELRSQQLLQLNAEGSKVDIKANEPSKLLILAGEPILEKKAMWGPYVMNTQTEIMEALRDYEKGKMGFLAG